MATVLPGFDRFQGVRGFLDNFVTGILSNQQNQRQLSDQQALLEFIQQSRSGQDPGIPQFATPQGAAGFLSNQQAQPGFTLSPGETRFGPGGQQVASISKGPETRESTSQFTARLGQSILDGTATPGAQKMFERLASSPSTVVNVNSEQAAVMAAADLKIAEEFQKEADDFNEKNPGSKTLATVKTNTTTGERFIAIEPKPKVQGIQLKQVQALANIKRLLDKVAEDYDPAFVGLIDSPAGLVGEFTGTTSAKEVRFRRNTLDIRDTILRERSGAAINEAEDKRLGRLVADLNLADEVFPARLQSLRDAIGGKLDLVLKSLQASGIAATDLQRIVAGEVTIEELAKEKIGKRNKLTPAQQKRRQELLKKAGR